MIEAHHVRRRILIARPCRVCYAEKQIGLLFKRYIYPYAKSIYTHESLMQIKYLSSIYKLTLSENNVFTYVMYYIREVVVYFFKGSRFFLTN